MTIWARGAGRGARCGARVPCGCVPFPVSACGTGALWAGVRWELCAPGLCTLAWYTGARPRCPCKGFTGIEAQVGRSSLHMAELHASCLVSRLLPRMGMKVTFDPHPAPLLIACGPFLCSPLCQGDSGWVLSCVTLGKSSGVYDARVPQLGSRARYTWASCAFLAWGPIPPHPRVRYAGAGPEGVGVGLFRGPRNSWGGRSLGTSGRFPHSAFPSGCPVPPAPSDSAPGSRAEPERERWRRPGTRRATFVLGADCGRQTATPSGPGRKGARACARPWKPRLLPVPASESQETKSPDAQADWGGTLATRPRARSAVGAAGLG